MRSCILRRSDDNIAILLVLRGERTGLDQSRLLLSDIVTFSNFQRDCSSQGRDARVLLGVHDHHDGTDSLIAAK
jgi:hypothetical protein